VRIFTPGEELPFAGHPTLGSAWVLGDLLGKDTVTLQLGVGLVPVELERDAAARSPSAGCRSRSPASPATTGCLSCSRRSARRAPGCGRVYDNGPRHVYVEMASEAAVAA